MSNFSSLFQANDPNIAVGTIKFISNYDYTSAPNIVNDGVANWVKANNTYAKATYPILANMLGNIGAAAFTARTSGTSSPIYSLVYGNGLYVATGQNMTIRYSTDAITWNGASTLPATTTYDPVTVSYVNNKYLVGGTTLFGISSDGANNWSNTYSWSVTDSVYDGSGQFVFVGMNSLIFKTSNVANTTGAYTAVPLTPQSTTTLQNASDLFAIAYNAGTYAIASGDGNIFTSTNGANTWTKLSVGTSATALYDITYANNIWVTVGNAIARTSTDAITWTSRTVPANTWTAVGYGSGNFVIGGSAGVLASSTDAITWTAKTSPTSSAINAVTYQNNIWLAAGRNELLASTDSNTWYSLFTNNQTTTYGNGLYVIGAAAGRIATSTNGTTWSLKNSGTTSAINRLTYGNGVYVAVGAGGLVLTSTDATTWTSRTSGTASALNAVTYGNGLYVYGGAGGVLASSTDAITWTARTSGTVSIINTLAYGNGKYAFGAAGGGLSTSTDAITWTARTSGTATAINAISYQLVSSADLWVYGSNGTTALNLRTSTDAITWTARTFGETATIRGLTYGNNILVAGTQAGTIRTSTDGITWTLRTSGTTSSIQDLTYGSGGGFVSAISLGSMSTSTDGTTWAVYGPAQDTLTKISYDSTSNLFVVAGGTGVYQTSPDGLTWTPRTTGTTSTFTSLTYGGNQMVYTLNAGAYLAVAGNAGVGTTTNHSTFTTIGTGIRANNISSIISDGTNFVIGYNGAANVDTTYDGILVAKNPGTFSAISSLAFANGLYIAGSSTGGLATSTDLTTWTTQTSGTSSSILSIMYGNGVYMYTGANLALATSTDAVTWTSKTTGVGLNSTALNIYGAYNNNTFVIAGGNGVASYAQYSTDNGETWIDAGLGVTNTVNSLIYGNGLWVAGGNVGALLTSANVKASENSPNYDATTNFYVPDLTSGLTTANLYPYNSSVPVAYVKAQ